MSRCVLDNDETGDEVVVGWDSSLETFFAQVIKAGADEPVVWIGASPTQCVNPNEVIDAVMPFAAKFDRALLLKELLSDRDSDSERVYSV